jgi:hypothetical protein
MFHLKAEVYIKKILEQRALELLLEFRALGFQLGEITAYYAVFPGK